VGETVRREDPRVKILLDKGQVFSLHDRRELLGIIGDLLRGIIPRYRALAERGQVELSVTPYAHPKAMPEAPLPHLTAYPGGEERVRWHLEHGIRTFERCFGMRPRGCWPSEGSVSDPTIKLLGEYGFHWTASGESVLRNSLQAADMAPDGPSR